MAYTLDDLERARQKVQHCRERIDNHSANNPNFGQSELRSAALELELIVYELKARGLIPLTDKEKLEAELDRAFPNAQSKQIIEYEGVRYQLRFYPSQRSRSGKTVKQWARWWEKIDTPPSGKKAGPLT